MLKKSDKIIETATFAEHQTTKPKHQIRVGWCLFQEEDSGGKTKGTHVGSNFDPYFHTHWIFLMPNASPNIFSST